MKVHGLAGYLLTAGRRAAELGEWQMDGDPAGWEVVADVVKADSFWLEHGGPLRLCLVMGERRWCWGNVTVNLSGEQIIISCADAPEVR